MYCVVLVESLSLVTTFSNALTHVVQYCRKACFAFSPRVYPFRPFSIAFRNDIHPSHPSNFTEALKTRAQYAPRESDAESIAALLKLRDI